jgi:hypothetical protein
MVLYDPRTQGRALELAVLMVVGMVVPWHGEANTKNAGFFDGDKRQQP